MNRTHPKLGIRHVEPHVAKERNGRRHIFFSDIIVKAGERPPRAKQFRVSEISASVNVAFDAIPVVTTKYRISHRIAQLFSTLNRAWGAAGSRPGSFPTRLKNALSARICDRPRGCPPRPPCPSSRGRESPDIPIKRDIYTADLIAMDPSGPLLGLPPGGPYDATREFQVFGRKSSCVRRSGSAPFGEGGAARLSGGRRLTPNSTGVGSEV